MKFFILFCFSVLPMFALNILILNSYESTFAWTQSQTSAIIEKLHEKNLNHLHIYTEYMDTKVLPLTAKREQNILGFLQNKYEKIPFDIVVTTDDNALKFVEYYKEKKLFKKAKVFFSGVNTISLASQLNPREYAGVFEKKHPLKNFNLAKKINPRLKVIYLVTDDSKTSTEEMQLYQKQLHGETAIKLVYIQEKNIENVLKKLKHYEPESIMILLVFSSFQYNHQHLPYQKAAQLLSQVYQNPMLVHTHVYINIPHTNIVAGDCTDGKVQGTMVAKKIFQYLLGTKMQNIGFEMQDGNRIYLNVKNLHRYNIHINDLGVTNPKLVNPLTSFYDLYASWIYAFLIILGVILLLFYTLTKKNQSLKKALKNLKILAETAFGGIIVLDPKMKIEYVNQRVFDITAFEHHEMLRMHILKFVHPNDVKIVENMIETQQEKPIEIRFLKKNHTFFYVLLRCRKMSFNNKIYMIIGMTDISDMKRQEEKIIQMNETLKEEIARALEENTKHLQVLQEQNKLASMGEMIGSIAHQWRQPLNALNINVQNLDDDYDEGLIDKHFIDNFIIKNRKIIEFMDKTIDDFRNFFKIDKEVTCFSVAKIIDEVLVLESSHLKNNHILVTIRGDDFEVRGFANEFKQVILNLLSNARGAILDHAIEQGYIEIILDAPSLKIQDNGGGIKEEIMDRIFEPYFTTKSQSYGTGVGLYMSKIIIEKNMGGILRVENTQDGALFEIITQN
ncbi:PAS domain-containing sensor histidine kinase [Sulfurospirillum sp. 1612]|uniref:PAS domain-containing sensor histidine kinase n=1 Tax=Sulfurospirillum sp. 1612 TaxID=3094835 RepID=UPI002F93E9D8